jgi:hypothetical protein
MPEDEQEFQQGPELQHRAPRRWSGCQADRIASPGGAPQDAAAAISVL